MHKRRSLAARFFAKVGTRTDSGCMEWRGTFLNSGYGQIRVGGRNDGRLLAHRAAWQLAHGSIPNGMVVMHKCDNKRCVNAEHLALGSQTDNMQDSSAKGRARKTRLMAAVPEIIALRKSGLFMREIAQKFGVSRPFVSMLLSGKIKSVPSASAGSSLLENQ